MRFRPFSTALACSLIVGSSTMIGCDSQPTVDAKAAAENKAGFDQQNQALAETVKKDRGAKGAIPKSIKGGARSIAGAKTEE